MRVELTYFKPSGKYYAGGNFYVDEGTSLLDIWHLVEERIAYKDLPGLVQGCSEFIVLVNVPGHTHEHPKLFNIQESLICWEAKP
jgi:hypothetical protein